MSVPFPARFEGGMCPNGCGSRIHVGDMITFREDGHVIHAGCAPKPDPFEIKPGETQCPDCFCIRPCRCVDD